MAGVFIGFLANLTDVQQAALSDAFGFEMPAESPPPQPPDVPVADNRFEPVGVSFDRAPGLAQELIREHFPRGAWENMARLGECESNWIPSAHNPNGEDSRGFWQINIGPGANTDMADRDLWDPVENAEAAAIIWRRQGYRAWLNCAKLKGVPLTGAGVI